MKSAGKASERNTQRLRNLFYYELFNRWSTIQGLGMASVASLILDECEHDVSQFEELCERICDFNRGARSSAQLSSVQPKKWNFRLGTLQVRYFVSGKMSKCLGLRYEKRKGNHISYWVAPVVKIERKGKIVLMKMGPSFQEDEIEDRKVINLDFSKDPEIREGEINFLGDEAEKQEFSEAVGIMDFMMPGFIRIVKIR